MYCGALNTLVGLKDERIVELSFTTDGVVTVGGEAAAAADVEAPPAAGFALVDAMTWVVLDVTGSLRVVA